MTPIKKFLVSIILCFTMVFSSFPIQTAKASNTFAFVILSKYKATVDIGNEFYLIAVTSNGKLPSWKSSNSTVASVNTYGKVVAKNSGTATITAKINNAEASCKVTVNKTTITINKSSASLERGQNLQLSAKTSNGSAVIWKSSKKSVATIDEQGIVTALKPGETIITASSNGSNITCKINVKSPTISLNKTKITLYRGQTAKLLATVSSGIPPVWKVNKKSVAIVDPDGIVTAIKHGTATITATVDGVSKTCEIIVKQPTITLSSSELNIKKGETATLIANVSSGNIPIWSTSNPNIVTVDETGKITGLQTGKAYIYAAEDGIKMRCTVYVTEK